MMESELNFEILAFKSHGICRNLLVIVTCDIIFLLSVRGHVQEIPLAELADGALVRLRSLRISDAMCKGQI